MAPGRGSILEALKGMAAFMRRTHGPVLVVLVAFAASAGLLNDEAIKTYIASVAHFRQATVDAGVDAWLHRPRTPRTLNGRSLLQCLHG